MNNPYYHSRKSESINKRTLSLINKYKQSETSAFTIAHTGVSGLNSQFLHARRQNYLNTGYNNRRQKLQDITIENRKIYCKLNSQKSTYSREELRKSYQSNASLSRRLSSSKISRKMMSSRVSLRSSQVKKDKKVIKPKKCYHIQTNSIQTINMQELKKFNHIFRSNAENLVPQTTNKPLKKVRKQSISTKSAHNDIKFSLPPIKRASQFRKPSTKTQMDCYDGSFLHIIAEQMFGKHKNVSSV